MRLFSRFDAREGRFFTLFDQHASFVVQGSVALVELLRNFDDNGNRANRVSRQRASAVRWGVAGNIVVAWIITIPAAALIAAISYWIGRVVF